MAVGEAAACENRGEKPVLSVTDMTLLAMAWLLTKHAAADFLLQNEYQWRNKGFYGHPGGLLHAGIHLVLTLPVFLLLIPPSLAFAAAVVAGEYVVHYHIDWLRERTNRLNNWTAADSAYWHVMGLDQLGHGLTYIAIVWVLLQTIRVAV